MVDIKEWLDEVCQKSERWDMKFIDRSFEEERVRVYLKRHDDEDTKNIIRKTMYIPFETFKKELLIQVAKLPPKFNIFFNVEHWGSENWIIVLVWKYIRDSVIQIITHEGEKVINSYPVVLIDDCIYSGNRMCYIVDTMRYTKMVTREHPFICVVAYRSSNGITQLTTDLGPVEVYCDNVIEPMFSKEDYERVYEKFGCETPYIIPIYFDHKIANNWGSFPYIYPLLVKNLPSREKIEELKREYLKCQKE